MPHDYVQAYTCVYTLIINTQYYSTQTLYIPYTVAGNFRYQAFFKAYFRGLIFVVHVCHKHVITHTI